MISIEELVTRKLANLLADEGWEIVAVHPPDGQGPFVIPKEAEVEAIERSSYHPDIVAIRKGNEAGYEIAICECKDFKENLASDYVKITEFSKSRFSILFAMFRCQEYPGGPKQGVDFEEIKLLKTSELPVVFYFAAATQKNDSKVTFDINGFKATEYLFNDANLFN